MYTCQLSRIMCESRACGSKLVISRIQTNFSCLTDNNECNCFKTFEKWSEHLQTMLEICWKSFGNRWPYFEVVQNLSTPSALFGSRRKSSAIFGSIPKNLDNLWKPSVNLWKFRFCEDEKSHAFY